LRAWIYDRAIRPLTGRWYGEVLGRIPQQSHILDVGIGTAGALLENSDVVRSKALRVTGVDIDKDYVRRARQAVWRGGMEEAVDVRLESVYDHRGGPYQAVYFSASFMLMPDPAAALRHVNQLLASDGRVYFTQTFQEKRSSLAEKYKPMLKSLTTVDFGRVTYEEDFLHILNSCHMDVLEMTTMDRKGARSFRLAVTRPQGQA
jgi:SAM-dependent methyltransferase